MVVNQSLSFKIHASIMFICSYMCVKYIVKFESCSRLYIFLGPSPIRKHREFGYLLETSLHQVLGEEVPYEIKEGI